MDPTESYQQAWEAEGIRAWFEHHCKKPDGDAPCAAETGEWYIDRDCHTRCKRCGERAT